jgi:hypothetical protein
VCQRNQRMINYLDEKKRIIKERASPKNGEKEI